MAVVLNSEDDSYFGSGSLQRSHSQTHFGNTSRTSYRASTSNVEEPYRPSLSETYSNSVTSSPASSPRTIHAEAASEISYASTPASNFSFASDDEEPISPDQSTEKQFGFPPYKQPSLYIRPPTCPDDNLEPPPSPKTGDSCTLSPIDYGSGSDDTPKPDTPEFPEHAEDDTAMTTRPSRQVDYLSHEWREEDIWSSWRYIVSRRGEYPNSERLENASWRTWMKSKNNLRTISPETLNWLKECDVTWLYGPLQPGVTKFQHSKTETSSVSLSKSSSFVNLNKKPILKKRSMSEVMLQRSLSTASLLKQATAAVQAQETKGILRPSLGRSNTDYVTYPFSSRRMSQGQSSVSASTESSGIASPSTERKHIHFNEQVEQCIALEVKGEDEEDAYLDRQIDDSDSDDGVVMKRTRSKKRAPIKKRIRRAISKEGKTIAMLPSTTLKYREDTPEPPETAMKHSRSPHISPSSSQETLRPSAGRFFLGDDEDDAVDGFYDPDTDWASPAPDHDSDGLPRSTSSGDLASEPAGMRRTPSGMFMPYDEGQGSNGDGIFGRVVDTVNTARDIAHVIWNVGWRK